VSGSVSATPLSTPHKSVQRVSGVPRDFTATPAPQPFMDRYRIRIITGSRGSRMVDQTTHSPLSLSSKGSANPELAKKIASILHLEPEPVTCARFADGECNIQIENNVRGADVFLIQPTCPPDINTHLVELLLLLQTLQLSSAKRITCVLPYYGYARQDRKTKPRVPISAAAVATMIETMGAHRLLTLELHCGQIQGFFRHIPVDNLYAENEFIEQLMQLKIDPQSIAIVSPDAGGVTRARQMADKIGAAAVVTILKRRVAANQVESMQLVGDVKGFHCFLVDDIIDTAGTIVKAADLLVAAGSLSVYAIATHGIFSGPAMERLNSSKIQEIWVTDSIPQTENQAKCAKLKVISVAPLLAEAIERLHSEKSLSRLFQTAQSATLVHQQDEAEEDVVVEE
jgi:ribose-phosphate pyrophosphokinase